MDHVPLPLLLEYLQRTLACCRSNAAFPHVPRLARDRLDAASDNIEFFLDRREYGRAFREATEAARINRVVIRFLHASGEATEQLARELSGG